MWRYFQEKSIKQTSARDFDEFPAGWSFTFLCYFTECLLRGQSYANLRSCYVVIVYSSMGMCIEVLVWLFYC